MRFLKARSVWIFFLLILVAGVVLWRWKSAMQSGADAPLGMPAKGEVDHRFQFSSAWDAVQLPVAVRFDSPMGSAHGALVYNAQRFWEMNEKRGGHHTGDDLNGIGGMNTDLGDPVFATADGRVLYVGEPSPGWGKVVVIGHQTLDGRRLHSMYAHLHGTEVEVGKTVARGTRIGAVGTATGYYPAHLHFEMRVSDGVDIGAGYGGLPLNRLDPMATVAALRHATADDLSPSPMAIVLGEPVGR